MSEATREMTFMEEYEILKSEKDELFATESNDSEPPFANCVVRRALRCIRKLMKEKEQFEAIGTVSEFRELKEKATAKKPVPYVPDCASINFIEFVCPNCKGDVPQMLTPRYCDCGQKLDWSEGKE